MDSTSILSRILLFVRFAAILGFLVVTVFLINLNHKALKNYLRLDTKSQILLFLISSVLPLALFLYVANFLILGKDLAGYGQLVLLVFGRR